MPSWLTRSDHAFEQVADFLRAQASRAPEQVFPEACQFLRQLWEAESVLLWQHDPAAKLMVLLAAAPPDLGVFRELALDAFPDLAQALERDAPLWVSRVAQRWRVLPPPLLQAQNVLLLPVRAGDRLLGAFFSLTGPGASPPDTEELEAGGTLAVSLAWLLQGESLRAQYERVVDRRQVSRLLSRDFQQEAPSSHSLARLAIAARDLTGAQAVALFERAPARLVQVAAAGARHLLPAELPWGEAPGLPWQQALAQGRSVEVGPGRISSDLEPWLPQLAHSGVCLRLLPLKDRGREAGLLALCGGSALFAADDDLGLLSLLLAAVLENRRALRDRDGAQEQYQTLFLRSGEGVFTLDSFGRLLSANPAFLYETGYSLAEIRGRSLGDFLPPLDWEAVCGWLQQPPERSFSASVRWRLRSGAEEEFELSLHAPHERGGEKGPGQPPPPPLLLGRLRSVARQRAAENSFRTLEARLLALLDSVHDGVAIIGTDGRIHYASPRLGQLLGVSHFEFGPGRGFCEVVDQLRAHFARPEAVVARCHELNARPDQIAWDEIELVRPRRRVLERFIRPLFDGEHQLVGRLEIFRDITSERLLEEKTLHREKLATLGQLVSGIAHELNNPLTVITGYAQLLRQQAELAPPLQEKIQVLVREAERAGRVSQNLLLFAREGRAEKEPVALVDIFERTLALRSYELRVANIRVTLEAPPDLPPVRGDAHQLQQVFLNLLLNAEQAIRSQRDYGHVAFRFFYEAEAERVRVEVTDDGPGIPPSVLRHIFDPFFTTKPAREGTGLGLSISQAILRDHGGQLDVRSVPGEGATFVVALPAYREDTPPLRPGEGPTACPEGAPAPGRVLVVDDEPAVAYLIADVLTQDGYAVSVHTESPAGLQEALNEPFRLIICDIRMPEVDGPAFYRALRQHRSELARRLLFTTGDTLAQETADFLAEVSLPHLPKPFRVDELRARVQQVMEALEGDEADRRRSSPTRLG